MVSPSFKIVPKDLPVPSQTIRDRIWLTRKYLRRNFAKDISEPSRFYRRSLYAQHGVKAPFIFALKMLEENAALKHYQPLVSSPQNEEFLPAIPKVRRSCTDRWELLEPHLLPAESFLDVGSESGYFVFKMGTKVKFCLGMERDPKAYAVACALAPLNAPGAAFLNASLDISTVKALPTMDTISCFSVFHWLVLDFGLDEAKNIMRELANRCRNQFLFETGQSDEPVEQFYSVLGFMGSDPKQWIKAFLHSMGFEEVLCLGRCSTSVSNVPRHLFVANRKKTHRH